MAQHEYHPDVRAREQSEQIVVLRQALADAQAVAVYPPMAYYEGGAARRAGQPDTPPYATQAEFTAWRHGWATHEALMALEAQVARLEERDEGRVRGVDRWREAAEAEHAEVVRLRFLFGEVYARNRGWSMGIRWRDWADEQKDRWRKEAREWLDGERERLDSHDAGPTIAELLADAQGGRDRPPDGAHRAQAAPGREERMKQVPAIEVFLPMPPSTNNLFRTFVNSKTQAIRRARTKEYEAWIEEAGRGPLAGEWRRITEVQGNGIPWELHITVYGLPPNGDISNRIKAAEDLLCAMTGLEDRNTRRITVDRADADPLLGACIQVCAMTVGEGVEQ